MSSKSITIRTETEIVERLSALAKSMDRSRNWVIERGRGVRSCLLPLMKFRVASPTT